MATKHFFKILTLFTVMIVLGLIAVFIVNNFGDAIVQATGANNKTPVAK